MTDVLERPAAPPASRSWRRMIDDITEGVRQRPLWLHLGWQDVKHRYRRSALGPLWITISMGVMVFALGILFSQLYHTPLNVKLPDLAVGLIVWNFISGCVLEGAEVFISSEGLIKQMAAPLSIHIFRLVWRQTLLMGHNMLIYVVLLVIFRMPVHWTVIMVVPAFALLMLNGAWAGLLFGVIAARFRDVPPIIQSFMTMALYITPITWSVQEITDNGRTAWRAIIANVNPFYHYIEIVRDPLLGQKQLWSHWEVVLLGTVVGWAVTLLFVRSYRARVSYWV